MSYFAMSAYQTAVLKPPHLKAIMVWEGISDIYREVNCPGGIPNVPFQSLWMNMTGNGLSCSEDHAVASIEHPLFDDYWQSKVVDWSLIDIPALSVTGWSSLGLHLRGTIEAWKKFSSPDKFLLVHVSISILHGGRVAELTGTRVDVSGASSTKSTMSKSSCSSGRDTSRTCRTR